MREHRGTLGGVPWVGWLCERPADLVPFMEWVRRQRDTVCFDTETCGLKIYSYGPDFLRLAQFGTATEAWVIPVELGPAFRQAATDALRILPSLTGHNVIAFDGLVVDKHLGVTLEEFCPKTQDTMITAKLIDPRGIEAGGMGAKLKPHAAFYVDPSAPDTQEGLDAVFRELGYTKKSGLGWIHVPWDHHTYVEYAMLDVILGSRVLVAHTAELERLGVRPTLVQYERELSRMAAVMSRAGMLVDEEYTKSRYDILDAETEKYTAIAARYGVDKIGSPKQVIAALQGMGEELTKKTDSGKSLSVDGSVLRRLADVTDKWAPIGSRTPNPLANAVLHAARSSKWKTTYLDTFLDERDESGRIHPNIQTLEARTGRMSITKPAVQTLPSGDWMIRRCIITDPGWVQMSIDFKAVEMRVLAALANVRAMKQAIANGMDLHDYTATLVFGPNFTPAQRKLAKAIGLGKIFGGGADHVAGQTGAPVAAVKGAMDTYDRVYPEIRQASNRWQREARQNGGVTISRTGRRLPLDRTRMYAVVNYQCQSAARDVLGQSMINMEAAGLLPLLRLPIHDEVLATAPAADAQDIAREIQRCMTFQLDGVPIEADPDIAGRSWGSLYMKNAKGKYDPATLIANDPHFAAHPAEAHAMAA
ncbi:DNA polymerase [Streptomyces sp. NBC_00841]|uniref:DNA polymerase n=1 Tax=Streptomyces sp. NBC_00841 TaxID=2975847 RepID=UPI002DDA2E1F|nr:DNA polymerase [Streptomyces sp. NBC_00841]WRZ98042.1 DNA polymerase [Streptomyces sp. NBC_00841]